MPSCALLQGQKSTTPGRDQATGITRKEKLTNISPPIIKGCLGIQTADNVNCSHVDVKKSGVHLVGLFLWFYRSVQNYIICFLSECISSVPAAEGGCEE